MAVFNPKRLTGISTRPMSNRDLLVSLVAVSLILLSLSGCSPDIPEQCGQNVQEIRHLDFDGPSIIPEDSSAGYEVAVEIQKENENDGAVVCLLVRDADPVAPDDPLGIDDVLDALIVAMRGGENTGSADFVLRDEDGEICGTGVWNPEFAGCSSERDISVYLQGLGSSGVESPRHSVSLEAP